MMETASNNGYSLRKKLSLPPLLLSLLLVWSGLGAEGIKSAVAFDLRNENLPDQEYSRINSHWQLELKQKGKYNILPPEWVKESFRQANLSVPSDCQTPKCLVRAGSVLPQAAYLFAGTLSRNSDSLLLNIKIFDNKAKSILWEGREGAREGDSAYIILPKAAATAAFSGLQRSFINDSLPPPEALKTRKAPLLLASAALLAAGGALAHSFGILEGKDGNPGTPGGILGHPDDLSSLRGFYAVPTIAPEARGQGGAGVAAAHGASAPMMNPAGIVGPGNQELHYSHTILPGGVPSFYLAYAALFSGNLYQSLSLRQEGDELANEITLSLTLAGDLGMYFQAIQKLKWGVNLKGYLLSVGSGGTGLDRSTGYGQGVGLDLGLQFPLTHKIDFGLMLRDLYSYLYNSNTLTNREYQESLPPELTLGFRYQVNSTLALIMDGEKALWEDQVDHIRLGGTQLIFNVLNLRLGTHQIVNRDNSRYLTMGVGFAGEVNKIHMSVDYGFDFGVEKTTSLTNQHQFGLNMIF